MKKEADNVTRLLCSVLRKLEKASNSMEFEHIVNVTEGLKNWWESHKEIDRKRIEQEVKKAEESLSDLSKEAREMLIERLKGK